MRRAAACNACISMNQHTHIHSSARTSCRACIEPRRQRCAYCTHAATPPTCFRCSSAPTAHAAPPTYQLAPLEAPHPAGASSQQIGQTTRRRQGPAQSAGRGAPCGCQAAPTDSRWRMWRPQWPARCRYRRGGWYGGRTSLDAGRPHRRCVVAGGDMECVCVWYSSTLPKHNSVKRRVKHAALSPTLKMYMLCTGVGCAWPSCCMMEAMASLRDHGRNTGSMSCMAWPILLMLCAFGCTKRPSASNAFSSKKQVTPLALSRNCLSVFSVCGWC